MSEHADVSRLNADAPRALRVIQERAPRGPHGGNELALSSALAAGLPAIKSRPAGRTVPPPRGHRATFADLIWRCRQRRAPRILMEVEQSVDSALTKHGNRPRDLVEIGIVVLACHGLDP